MCIRDSVLVREDFNVPMKGTRIADDTRIIAALPTLRTLLERKARVIVLSHLGRPNGKTVADLSLRPIAEHVGSLLETEMAFATDCVGPEAACVVNGLEDGEIALLENVRFHPEEERNDPAFAKLLAQNGDLYVNDAFGTAHRAHASTEGLGHLLPCAAGLLMQSELEFLSKVVGHPEAPYVCALSLIHI